MIATEATTVRVARAEATWKAKLGLPTDEIVVVPATSSLAAIVHQLPGGAQASAGGRAKCFGFQ